MRPGAPRSVAAAAMASSSPSPSARSSSSPRAPPSSPFPASFTALTYNILAKSLGTCAIPWVLPRPSPSLLRRVEEEESSSSSSSSSSSPPRSWDDLKNGPIKEEYLRHFHKNFDSGNYASMRGLWAAPSLTGRKEDIPEELRGGVRWEGMEDAISYRRGGGKDSAEDDDAEDVTALTLRGVLRRELPEELAVDLFEAIRSREEGVYRWDVRGPRIFRTAISIVGDSAVAESVASGSEPEPKTEAARRRWPDLIALQEYDVHGVVADYRGLLGLGIGRRGGGDDDDGDGSPSSSPQEEETFADAMSAVGYDGAFFKDPLRGRTPPSGLGLFWRRETFVPADAPSESESKKSVGAASIMAVVEPDETELGGSLRNVDLRETWHPKEKKKKKAAKKDDAPPSGGPILMPPADRRNAALARLRHVPTGRTVLACAVHLMTTSRDCAKSNWYPGEVRAGELAALGEAVRKMAKKEDEVLVLGDFNTDALGDGGEGGGEAPEVFRGRIRRALALSEEGASAGEPSGEVLEVNTGFDTASECFTWGEHVTLRDAFSDVHRWGSEGSEQHRRPQPCTTKNADRTEWIDYVLPSSGLVVKERSECEAPEGAMPDEVHPSDHLPVWATFEFV